ncbi:hypothetical protein [Companilactobacillus mishanensis]|uniref:hypothetical protein n=1 Tax=Companilactobacillus mishanensis TaxID=2486008 RepID=UPI001295C3B6|nr:hypothetical protein [Companilactobacillus mishanensis]
MTHKLFKIAYWILVGIMGLISIALYFHSSDEFLYSSFATISLIIIRNYYKSLHGRPKL